LLGLWSDDRRTSRAVKALAQGHLDALDEKMREMAEMQRALRKLVASCHGDDDPHCAILDQLAVGSPEAPDPGTVGGRPVRRSKGKPAAPKRTARVETTAHVDLMAWTRNIHAGHEHH